jgi:ParB family transcriptional regulator, chromosome partitioning protein
MSKLNKLAGKLQNSVAAENKQATTRQQDKFARADEIINGANATMLQDPRLNTSSVPTEQPVAPNSISLVGAPKFGGQAQDGVDVRQLPLSQVLDHPRNARHIYDPSRVDEMAKAIVRDAQQVPVVVMPNQDPDKPGTFLVIDGRYRKKALTSLGRDTILASIIKPLPDREAYRLSLQLNVERNDQSVLDNALSWKSLLEEKVYATQDELAEHLNLGQGSISKVLGILELPPGVLGIIKTKPIAFGIRVVQELRQLSKKMPERELELIAEQVREEKLSARELERLRDRADREPVTRERSRAYALEWAGRELGSMKEFDDGRMKIDLVKAPPELRSKIIEAVKQILSETPADSNVE